MLLCLIEHLISDLLRKIIKLTNTWLMRLNVSKCKVMHIGSKKKYSSYMMRIYDKHEALPISKTELEKELGIIYICDS